MRDQNKYKGTFGDNGDAGPPPLSYQWNDQGYISLPTLKALPPTEGLAPDFDAVANNALSFFASRTPFDKPVFDEFGNPVYVQMLDENGVPVFEADGTTPVYEQMLDEYGVPVFEADGITPVYEQAYESLLETLLSEKSGWSPIQSGFNTNAIANSYESGRVLLGNVDGSTAFITNAATGQFLSNNQATFEFNYNTPGTSSLSTAINYIGKNYGLVEETMASKISEVVINTVGQKADINGEMLGLNSIQKIVTSNFAYKDGINTADKSDNVTLISKIKTNQIDSFNSTALSDVLSTSFSENSSSSVSEGAGTLDSYSQRETLNFTSLATLTFNADSSVVESYKENEIATASFIETRSDINDDDVDGIYNELASKVEGSRNGTSSETFTSSINVNGELLETETGTWNITFNTKDVGISEKYQPVDENQDPIGDPFPGEAYTETANLILIGSYSESTNLQKAIGETTNTYTESITFKYSDVAKYYSEAFDLSANLNFKYTDINNISNITKGFNITNLAYSDTFDHDGSTTTPFLNFTKLNLVASATNSVITDANDNSTSSSTITITSGSLTRMDWAPPPDEFSPPTPFVKYSITATTANTLTPTQLSSLEASEISEIGSNIAFIEAYLQDFTAPSGSDGYIPGSLLDDNVDYFAYIPVPPTPMDHFEQLILMGNNTITISNPNGEAIDGGLGNDTITGGTGMDQITGGRGADTLNGGLGNDIYYLNQYSGSSFGVAGGTFTGFDKITFGNVTGSNEDVINFGLLEPAAVNQALVENPLTLKSAAFATVNSVVTFLTTQSITANASSVIYVTDATSTAVNKGAIYYIENDSNSAVIASEVKLLAVTTGNLFDDLSFAAA